MTATGECQVQVSTWPLVGSIFDIYNVIDRETLLPKGWTCVSCVTVGDDQGLTFAHVTLEAKGENAFCDRIVTVVPIIEESENVADGVEVVEELPEMLLQVVAKDLSDKSGSPNFLVTQIKSVADVVDILDDEKTYRPDAHRDDDDRDDDDREDDDDDDDDEKRDGETIEIEEEVQEEEEEEREEEEEKSDEEEAEKEMEASRESQSSLEKGEKTKKRVAKKSTGMKRTVEKEAEEHLSDASSQKKRAKIASSSSLSSSSEDAHAKPKNGFVDPNRPFQCMECESSFKYRNHFKDHLRVHTDDTFECPICRFETKAQSLFTTHMTKHGSGQYSCSDHGTSCKKVFNRLHDLARHLPKDHGIDTGFKLHHFDPEKGALKELLCDQARGGRPLVKKPCEGKTTKIAPPTPTRRRAQSPGDAGAIRRLPSFHFPPTPSDDAGLVWSADRVDNGFADDGFSSGGAISIGGSINIVVDGAGDPGGVSSLEIQSVTLYDDYLDSNVADTSDIDPPPPPPPLVPLQHSRPDTVAAAKNKREAIEEKRETKSLENMPEVEQSQSSRGRQRFQTKVYEAPVDTPKKRSASGEKKIKTAKNSATKIREASISTTRSITLLPPKMSNSFVHQPPSSFASPSSSSPPPPPVQSLAAKSSVVFTPTGNNRVADLADPSDEWLARYPLDCAACGLGRFKSEHYFQNHHRNVHNVDRPWICQSPGCTSSFRQVPHYREHIRGTHHPNVKTFKCIFCDYRCPTATMLTAHRAKQHSCFACPKCSKKFNSNRALYEHQAKQGHYGPEGPAAVAAGLDLKSPASSKSSSPAPASESTLLTDFRMESVSLEAEPEVDPLRSSYGSSVKSLGEEEFGISNDLAEEFY